ncbi:phage scaffolding protein [Streptomyces hydrogenans]|uniref:phage scaffolding protein n=1 Tax=Streptomyces hydrogenans TaxID=1873719 RepID=UPI0036E5AD17
MRRPTQHPAPTPRGAWSHPYTGVQALGVFYNSGGGTEPTPPAAPAAPAPQIPTPADLAARTAPAATPEYLVDKDTGLAMTQARFNVIMTRENTKGRRAVLRELAEASGLEIDDANFDPKAFGAALKAAEEARKAQLTAEQQAAEAVTAREQAIKAREDEIAAREQAAAARERETTVRAELARLGAHGDDQDDAYALLKDKLAADTDPAGVAAAATALKERRPGLFGAAPAPTPLPPAPSGLPAGGPPQRTPAGVKDAVTQAARERAISMGLRSPDAA